MTIMNLNLLDDIISSEPNYRKKQINKAIFHDFINDWSEITNLPLILRNKLAADCSLEIKHQLFIASDKRTYKALIDDKIETVLMRHQDHRNTVCVSSQIGCPLGCTFCYTGKMGFKRNLASNEIIEQVLLFSRLLKREKQRVDSVVFMGMGEPFLNYNNVLAAIRLLNNKDTFNIGARHISVSTSGMVEGIKKFTQEKLDLNLAISLHAPNDALRSQLMPVNIKQPLKNIMQAVDAYVYQKNRKVMFEYVMLKDINDKIEHAEQLVELLDNRLYFVNLIVYNATGVYQSSTLEQIKKFKDYLEKHGLRVTERYRFGKDIKAACGQLAVNNPSL